MALLLLVGTLAYLPALRSPFWMDDYLHIAMIDGTFPAARDPLNLYDFINDAERPKMVERGMLPWWTHPKLRIRFLRPLSSALIWADHRVLGHRPLLLHLHSLLWWAAAVLAARALFVRLFSSRAAFIATAIFALAPCHSIPLAWLANRDVIVAVAIGTLALAAYVRWRDARRLRDGVIATLLFAVAMLGGEYSLCFGGYVAAIEIVRADGFSVRSLERRAVGLLPFAAPAAIYLWVRAVLGYGTSGSGFYRDPLGDPAAFLRTFPRRLVVLLTDGWLTPDADDWGPDIAWWVLALIAVVMIALLVIPMRRAFAALRDDRRSAAKWLLLGSLLSLVPVLAVSPSVRLISVSVLGIAAVVAVVLDHAWFPEEAPPRRGLAELTGLVALLLGFVHLVHSPAMSWFFSRAVRESAVRFATRADWVKARLTHPANAHVVVMRATWQATFFGPFAMDPGRAPPPASWRVLTQTQGHLLALRKDARTIELVSPRGKSMFPWGTNDLFRSDDSPLHVGDEVVVPGMSATVLEADDRGPYRVRFTFDRDLEDGSLLWLVENANDLREARPPAPGFGMPLDP